MMIVLKCNMTMTMRMRNGRRKKMNTKTEISVLKSKFHIGKNFNKILNST